MAENQTPSWIDPVVRWWNELFGGKAGAGPRGGSGQAERPRFWTTGPAVIDRIVRAIELDQSVLLTGARGCGKTYCVKAAIKEAMRLGIVSANAVCELQGNREVPRDYLGEDELVFRTFASPTPTDPEAVTVLPARRSAPLFTFAARHPRTGEPALVEARAADRVVQTELRLSSQLPPHPVRRFVLFLDEINRFSDGVLDSLLSILEERTAYLAGQPYRLPVVVLMTMNPPGYDATARRLSPPLAARIGRSYTLFMPNLDTLTDQIVSDKLSQLEKKFEKDRVPAPIVSPSLRRRVALAVLCLWGNPKLKKPGVEYLTDDTVQMLEKVYTLMPDLLPHANWLSNNCRFGPDGRCPADWIAAAIAVYRAEAVAAPVSGPAVGELTVDHLMEALIEGVSHKIYDEFSTAAEPDKQGRKEAAIRAICDRVLRTPLYQTLPGLRRRVDGSELLESFKGLIASDVDGTQLVQTRVYRAFVESGVTDDGRVGLWLDAVQGFKPAATASSDEAADRLLGLLSRPPAAHSGLKDPVVHGEEKGVEAGFSDAAHAQVARSLARLGGPLAQALDVLLRTRVGPIRRSLDGLIEECARELIPALRTIGQHGTGFLEETCNKFNIHTVEGIQQFIRTARQLLNFFVSGQDTEALARIYEDIVTEAERNSGSVRLKGAIGDVVERLIQTGFTPEGVEPDAFRELLVQVARLLRGQPPAGPEGGAVPE